MRHLFSLTLLAALVLSGCDSLSNPETTSVAVRFEAAPEGAGKKAAPQAPLVLTANEDTLTITEVRLIVAEFELDRLTSGSDSVEVEDEDCKFEAAPFFLNLPLETGAVEVAAGEIPVDVYKELEFEVEDLDDDEEDPVKQQQIAALKAAILAEFPDWPDEASMMVAGTFLPAGSETPEPFKVYFDAEIEVEREFATPLDLASEGAATALTIQVDPASWFVTEEGVMDLSAHDYETTSHLLEFELEMEHGFRELKVELDD